MPTDRTYLYGYPPPGTPQTRLTLAGLETRVAWVNLAFEFKRRLLSMFNYGLDRGIDVGIGGGWRSSAQQEQVFRARYAIVPCSTSGSLSWNGQCWKLKPGFAPSAPPGRSYHETTPPNDGAIAADLIGNIAWADTVAAMFGLRSLANLTPPNNELWHHQPIEVATARRNYDGVPIWPFPLPDDPPPPPPPPPPGRMIPLMYRIRYKLDRWPGAFEAIVEPGVVRHAQSGNRGVVDSRAGVPLVELPREELIWTLEDASLRHVSIDLASGTAQNPFSVAYDNGNYHDTELELLWARRMAAV